ncbi:MAG: cobalamin B12-binding domain-containing protein [Halarcobacter sp.]
MQYKNYSLEINFFIDALLEPSMTKAISISKEYIKNNEDIKSFWEQIIVPSMHEIGKKWADNEITVGEEHTATSICQRVMVEHYEKILSNSAVNRRKIIVTLSPNELHVLGARIVADLLELNGYDVHFLDSNSTYEELLNLIKNENIKEIIISTTLISNLNSTENLISDLKLAIKEKIKFYVGGQAYKAKSEIKTKADFYIKDMDSLLKELEKENK